MSSNERASESRPERPAPSPEQRQTPARRTLGTTLAIFFTIVATGAALQTTCLGTIFVSSNPLGGLAVGIVAALITAGAMIKLFWAVPEFPPPESANDRPTPPPHVSRDDTKPLS